MNNQNSESEDIIPANEQRMLDANGSNNGVRFDQTVWITWWIGTSLIVGSWFGIVSNTVGWIGFAATLASTFISVFIRKYWKIPK